MLMRVMDGGANSLKEFQSLLCVESVLIAMVVDRQPLDVLHHQVRPIFFRRAAVEQARDVGMIERRQNLSLVAKATHDKVRVHAAANQLDCDLLSILIIIAFAEINRAHAAASELANDFVGAYARDSGDVIGVSSKSDDSFDRNSPLNIADARLICEESFAESTMLSPAS